MGWNWIYHSVWKERKMEMEMEIVFRDLGRNCKD